MFTSKYFNLGKIVCTATISNIIKENQQFAFEVALSLQRYAVKDWGELGMEDKKVNDEALNYPEDLYLLGVYKTCKGKIYIITNRVSEVAGDNATTICFPDER